jgi:hypothetical protein
MYFRAIWASVEGGGVRVGAGGVWRISTVGVASCAVVVEIDQAAIITEQDRIMTRTWDIWIDFLVFMVYPP